MRSIFIEPQYKKEYRIEKVLGRYEPILTVGCKNIWLENKEIYVCDIDRPILNVGELFYLKHINKYVTIQSAVRTSENEVIYRVEDNIFISEEERLHKSELEKEIVEIEKYKEIIDENGKKITELEDIINHIKDIVCNKVFIWTSELKKLLD